MTGKEKTHLLFIYGTLRRECRAHSLIEQAEYLGLGTTLGRLHYVDRYPGFVRKGDCEITGEIYRVSEELLSKLDVYEGCHEIPPDYTRELVAVSLEKGGSLECECYIFQLLDMYPNVLEYGDWIEFIKLHPELNA